MSRANPQIRNFAERLSVFEARRNRSIGTKTPAVFEGFEKLRPQLVPLMGTGGFQVLLARALALARSEVPWLRAVQVMRMVLWPGWRPFAHKPTRPNFSKAVWCCCPGCSACWWPSSAKI